LIGFGTSDHNKESLATLPGGAFYFLKDKNPFGIGTEGAIASTLSRISTKGKRMITDYLSVV
jgi:hypothetical protein